MIWLLLIGLLIASAVVIVLSPIFGNPVPWVSNRADAAVRAVKKEKAQVLRILKDLEFELENGSIDRAEYDRLARSHKANVVLLNRRLNDLGVLLEVADDPSPAPAKSEAPATEPTVATSGAATDGEGAQG